MRKIRWSTILFLSAAACGGQASNVDGASGVDGTGSGATSGGPTIVGGSGTTTPSSGVATATSGDTSSGAGTAGAPGGMGNPPVDGGGPAHTLPLITATACGTATCTSTQQCCVSLATGRNATSTVACQDTCSGASIAATCSSAASCAAGQVCCASLNLGGGGRGGDGGSTASASCENSCARQDGGARAAIAVQLCSTDAECPAGDTCRADALGLDICGPAPVVIDRDAGVRFGFDAGILPFFDGGIGQFFDGGGRRMRDAAARD
jgi:hypothetical protein